MTGSDWIILLYDSWRPSCLFCLKAASRCRSRWRKLYHLVIMGPFLPMLFSTWYAALLAVALFAVVLSPSSRRSSHPAVHRLAVERAAVSSGEPDRGLLRPADRCVL